MPASLLVVPRDGGAAVALPVFPQPILPAWQDDARAKGFVIAARVKDRLHVALRCERCGCVSLSRVYTLRTARPLCPSCLSTARSDAAEAAGAVFLRRDAVDTRYAVYGLPCGHEVRRQFGLISRAAAGETGIRCETCHAGTLEAEAAARGWSLVGPDPQGNPNYRLYAHNARHAPAGEEDVKCAPNEHVSPVATGVPASAVPTCGHVQRIARGNMVTGRFTCEACGEGWARAASAIYLMRFDLPAYGPVVKLGFSRDPASRLRFQLCEFRDLACDVRRIVPIASGRRAMRIERRMHGRLRREHPEAVVASRAWAGQIRVGSEIYDARLAPVIDAMLDAVETGPDEDAGDEDDPEASGPLSSGPPPVGIP